MQVLYAKQKAILQAIGHWFCAIGLLASLSAAAQQPIDSLKAEYPKKSLMEIIDSANAITDDILRIDTRSAIAYARHTLNEAKAIGYLKGHCQALNNMGSVFRIIGDKPRALEFHLEALELLEKTDSFPWLMSRTLVYTGALFIDLKNYTLAKNYYDRALAINQQINLPTEHSIVLHATGRMYQEQGAYKLALEYYEQSLAIARQIDNALQIRICLATIGQVYRQMGNYELALAYSKQTYLANSTILGLSYASRDLAATYLAMGNTEEAIQYATISKNQADSVGRAEGLVEAYQILSAAYQQSSNFEEALFFHQQYKTLTDSVFSYREIKRFTEIQSVFELQQKEAENALLRKDQKQKELVMWLGGVISVLLFGFSFLSYRAYRLKQRSYAMLLTLNTDIAQKSEEITQQAEQLQKSNDYIQHINNNLELLVSQKTQELVQANKDLDIFLYRSAHDIRRPISTLKGILEIARISVKEKEAKELFAQMSKTIIYMERLMEKLSAISYIYHKEKHPLILIEPLQIAQQVEGNFKESLNKYQIEWQVSIASDMQCIEGNPLMLEYALNSMVENAIEYRQQYFSKIALSFYMQDDKAVVQVTDNGQGIEEAYLQQVFDMFSVSNVRSKGTGLGLFIAKKAADVMHGSIEVHSKEGEGASFRMFLPAANKAAKRAIN